MKSSGNTIINIILIIVIIAIIAFGVNYLISEKNNPAYEAADYSSTTPVRSASTTANSAPASSNQDINQTTAASQSSGANVSSNPSQKTTSAPSSSQTGNQKTTGTATTAATTTTTSQPGKSTTTATTTYSGPVVELTLDISGQGTVNLATGTYEYPQGSSVTLSATPAPGWELQSWNHSSYTSVVNVYMNSDKTITAYFDQPSPYGTTTINHPPVLDPIGDKTVLQNHTLTFTISATDPDNDSLTYFSSGLPVGATFDPVTKTFSWTPPTAGTFKQISFGVSDGSLTDSQEITITVNPSTAYFLTIKISGQGSTNPATGSYPYDPDASVTVSATPASGWEFQSWNQAIFATSTTLIMNSNRTITAYFIQSSSN